MMQMPMPQAVPLEAAERASPRAIEQLESLRRLAFFSSRAILATFSNFFIFLFTMMSVCILEHMDPLSHFREIALNTQQAFLQLLPMLFALDMQLRDHGLLVLYDGTLLLKLLLQDCRHNKLILERTLNTMAIRLCFFFAEDDQRRLVHVSV